VGEREGGRERSLMRFRIGWVGRGHGAQAAASITSTRVACRCGRVAPSSVLRFGQGGPGMEAHSSEQPFGPYGGVVAPAGRRSAASFASLRRPSPRSPICAGHRLARGRRPRFASQATGATGLRRAEEIEANAVPSRLRTRELSPSNCRNTSSVNTMAAALKVKPRASSICVSTKGLPFSMTSGQPTTD